MGEWDIVECFISVESHLWVSKIPFPSVFPEKESHFVFSRVKIKASVQIFNSMLEHIPIQNQDSSLHKEYEGIGGNIGRSKQRNHRAKNWEPGTQKPGSLMGYVFLNPCGLAMALPTLGSYLCSQFWLTGTFNVVHLSFVQLLLPMLCKEWIPGSVKLQLLVKLPKWYSYNNWLSICSFLLLTTS